MKSNFAINGFKCVGVRCKFFRVEGGGCGRAAAGAGSWVDSEEPRVTQLELALPRQRQRGTESPRAWPLPPGARRDARALLWPLPLSPPKHPRPHPLPLAEDPRIKSRARSGPTSQPDSACPGPLSRACTQACCGRSVLPQGLCTAVPFARRALPPDVPT